MAKERILVPLDFSAHAEHVLLEARVLAEATGRELELLHVAAPDPEFVGYEAGPPSVRDSRADTLRKERRDLQALAEELEAAGIPTHPRVVEGSTIETILAHAADEDVRLVVMGTHGRSGIAHLLMGSVCEGVLREVGVPVLVVPMKGLSA